MSDATVPATVERVAFSFLTSDEIRRISVKQIVNATLFDATNLPSRGGLYDPALGPVKRGDQSVKDLVDGYTGHLGHIELPVPVFHIVFIAQMFALLRGSCKYCHHFLLPRKTILRYIAQLILLEHGLVNDAEAVDDLSASALGKAAAEAQAKAAKAKGKGKEKEQVKEENEEVEDEETTGESDDAYRKRLFNWVTICLKRARESTRDDYKPSLAFAKRKRLIADFLRNIAKRKCGQCGANAHRMRKEGHLKMIEFSLTPKQEAAHYETVRNRKTISEMESLYRARVDSAKAKAESQVNREADGDYDERMFDSDDGDEPGRGRVASPGSGSDAEATSDEGEDLMQDIDGATILDAATLAEPARKHRKLANKQTERIITAEECRAHLRLVFLNEAEICSLLYGVHSLPSGAPVPPRSDMFFVEVLAVPATRFRPASTMGETTYENEQNALFGSILTTTYAIRDISASLRSIKGKDASVDATEKGKLYNQLLDATFRLQAGVNALMDNTKNPNAPKGGQLPMGIKQLLEKKEGLFRMNMMGKRVNYSARSVISPDVNIETNEIGVPPIFAKKLTFPEPVTQHNIEYLVKLVINGPHTHPGAVYIEYDNGRLVSLARMSEEERRAQASQLLTPDSKAAKAGARPDVGLPRTRTPGVPRKVYRHLDDGDILILNRQPTLHKPSMMCHKARILTGQRTIRMHYANCNSYNADFDGDGAHQLLRMPIDPEVADQRTEMNMHFPQSLIAQAEAKLIANTDNQYLVPTSGNPLRGLIQDHVVAGVWMTNKDTFFDRSDYHQLIYGALRPEDGYSGEGMVLTVPPAIVRPKPLWTGKQIITTVLLNIKPHNTSGLHVKSKSKVPGRAWQGVASEEDTVHFYDGDYLTGILDKSQFGASGYGLVHAVYEVYGAEVAGKLLSIFSRLFTKYLQHRAFTCRMDDLRLTPAGNSWRQEIIDQADVKGYKAALEYVGLEAEPADATERAEGLDERLEEVLRDDAKMALLDVAVKSEVSQLTSAVISKCLPDGLLKPFPFNHMQTMTVSGAKGSQVNVSQISCLLGQQELEGRRVPTMVSGKTLPSFKAFETAPRAGGYVAQRFLTGIRPQEYYFHCMAGREGLIDTAVKTSRSGYLQRCLIKHLEGIRVHYDHTVRNSDGTVVQFLYGEDAIDVTKSRYLYEFDFAVNNRQSLVQRYRPNDIAGRLDETSAPGHTKAILKALRAQRKSEFRIPLPEPTQSVYLPSTYAGSVSEMYAEAIDSYLHDNPSHLLDAKDKRKAKWPSFIRRDRLFPTSDFRSLMYFRFMKSLADPGEAVGLLASQGVGEPSTQMTLNTFHFAGHGAANVTLGIPRLREIVMTASANIKTPTMKIPFLDSVDATGQISFCKQHTRLTLSQVVDEIVITETLSSKSEETDFARRKLYKVKLVFYPRWQYSEEYATTPDEVLLGISRNFIQTLDKEILKEFKKLAKQLKQQVAEVGKGKSSSSRGPTATTGTGEEDPEEGADARGAPLPRTGLVEAEEDDGDADDARRAARSHQQRGYDDSDDDMAEATAAPTELDEAAFDAEFGDALSDEEEMRIDPDETAEQREQREKREDRIKDLEAAATVHSRYIDTLRFDKDNGEWAELSLEFAAGSPKLLLVGIVERACRMSVVRQVPGITRCLVTPPEKQDPVTYCTTEGANLTSAWRFGQDVLDLNRIYSNDIAAILRIYGVEAARSTIIREMSGVFGAYGIGVDKRHLSLIADYMTGEGGYRPFNRTGLSTSSSPFLKASFETTSQFLADAAVFGDYDDMQSPSSSIVLGKVAHSGTGSFQIRMPLPTTPPLTS